MSLKILIVGGGSIGNKHAQICKDILPTAVVTICKVTASQVVKKNPAVDHYVFGVEDALDCKPDAVIIASPATLHLNHVLHFSKLTPNILVEKPLCWSLEELEHLTPTEIEFLAGLQVGYVLRFAPCLVELARLIGSQSFGSVMFANVWAGQHISAWRPGSVLENTVSVRKDLGGGVLAELSHEIDYTRFLFGRQTDCIGDVRRLSSITKDVPDYASLLLRYDELSVNIQLDFLRHKASLGIEVICESGEIVCDFASLIGRCYDANSETWRDFETNGMVEEFNDLYRWQLDYFLTKSFSDYSPRYESCWTDVTPALGRDAMDVVALMSRFSDRN